ncbi:MAG TPA: extracellular solute-binding protein [Jatrophihabitantaceae bacterium]|nr:extracellular solute-binding protein [Jatrophihabitantaceae bacterium]
MEQPTPSHEPTTLGLSRRDFLTRSGLIVAGSAGLAPILSACAGGGGGGGGGGGSSQIKILLWSHFVPQYDKWFDGWAKQWGDKNKVTVVVDHINQADLPARTAAEFAAKSGHDLIEWITPPSAYEPSVYDMSDVVKEAVGKYGDQIPFCKLSSFNPHTNKYYGFCHTWTPDPGDYRKSLWSAVGMPNGPTTWDELLTGGTEIQQQKKVRMGIGMSSEVDSNMAARALIWSYGGSVQDANENVTLNSPETVAAVEYMAKLYKQTMSAEVFSWTAASNNQGLVAGQLSYILNSISAYRSAQTTNKTVADDIYFLPALKGPGGTGLASQHVVRSYIMPKWAKNVDKCKQYLLDLVGAAHDGTYNSQLYDFPAFKNPPVTSTLDGWLKNDPFKSAPPDKLNLLATSQAWSTNVGHPGPANPAIGEIFDTNVLSTMMADVARGKSSAQDAVSSAHQQCETIFKKWRDKNLVGGTK